MNYGGMLPVGFSPRPLATVPFSLRSICQLSVSPALFFMLKAKMALPCLIASFRSASLCKASLIASKATEEGNLSTGRGLVFYKNSWGKRDGWCYIGIPFFRPIFARRVKLKIDAIGRDRL